MRPRATRLLGMSLIFVLLFALLQTPAFAQAIHTGPLITQPVDETRLIQLKGNVHPLARPQFDRGAAPPSLPMQRMLLVLKRSPEQDGALLRLLDEQQDKASPNYHKWLTPIEFGKQFGPSDEDLQVVTSWLQAHGFQVAQATKGRTTIEFSGTAAQVQEALHTEIHKFVVKGEEHWANASDPQIPEALAPVVAGVNTLHNFRKKPMNQFAGIYKKSRTTGQVTPVHPQFTFPGGCDPDNNCYAVGPFDFATIYNVLPLWTQATPVDGTGQTIAIVARSNINVQDARDFRNVFGLPANDPVVTLNGPDPGLRFDESEADIDVEWSGAVAKNATIDLVVSESTTTSDGVDLSALYIVDNNLAPVMSESFGNCELSFGTAGNQFTSQLWEQAAAQGITVMVSSGDNGSAGCDFNQGFVPQPAQFGLAVSGNASTPFNVAVGGTDFNDLFNPLTFWNSTNDPSTNASAKGYIPETTWNDSCTNGIFGDPRIGGSTNAETNCNNSGFVNFVLTIGGSGGASNCTSSSNGQLSTCSGGYPKPSWQTGTPADGKRDIPDVSLFASNGFVGNFYVVCEADLVGGPCDLNSLTFAGFGGTSVSSPAFAGIMALVNQQTNSRQGNANYVLYKLAAKQSASACNSSTGPASTCIFNDVTSGTIAMPCTKGSANCTTSNTAHRFGVLSGYSAGTGYDLATGLGSVNAENLVKQWSTVTTTFKATTTTLALGSTGIHGGAVNVSITVSSGSGTPTGDVSLLTSTGKGVDVFTLSGGSASASTNFLPGGSYTVTAHYPGDGTFGASDSSPVSVTVGPEASKTAVAIITFDPNTGQVTNSNATTAVYGSPYILRVDVTNAGGASCAANPLLCPSGSVTLTDNGSPLDGGTFTLNSLGHLEDDFIQLPAGSHTLLANYTGDSSFTASAAPADVVTITKAATTSTLTSSLGSIAQGQSVTLTATVDTSSFGSAPGGTVTFFSGTTQIGSVAPTARVNPATGTAEGVASLTTTALPTGQDSITAGYGGDTNYTASTSSAITVNVDVDFAFTASAPSVTVTRGGTGTLTLTIAGQSAYHGTVNFSSASCAGLPSESKCTFVPASVTGSGTTTLTVSAAAPHHAALGNFGAWTSGGFMLAGVFLVGISPKRRRCRALFSLTLLAFVLTGGACGGGSGSGGTTDPGTPLGSFPVIVTATTSGTPLLSHAVPFTLNVQ